MQKILLASEYKVFLNSNANLLKNWGFQLFTTTSGAEALKLHEEHNFDLILVDFNLKDMGGCTLCSLIRREETSCHVPIVIACYNIPARKERVEKCGASAMLLKPVEPMKLLETVGSYLGVQLGRSKRVALKVKVLSKASDLEFFCLSHDISNTGILIETEYKLELGSRIICQFALPELCKVETEGEVSRSKIAFEGNLLYGIKFIALPISARKAINTYISSLLH